MNYNDNEYDNEQDFQDYGYEQQNSDNRAKNPSNILLQTTKAFANGAICFTYCCIFYNSPYNFNRNDWNCRCRSIIFISR